jgi:hypothetical protein
MKKLIIFFLCCFCSVSVYCQTRDQDIDYVTGSFVQDVANTTFTVSDISSGGYVDPEANIKYVVEIKKLVSSDEKNRGLILFYYELSNNTKSHKKAFCIPAKGSEGSVQKRCLRMISDIADPNELRVMLWAVSVCCANRSE